MKRERDELDSLAADAGQSAFLVGMTALILVMALVLGFRPLTSDRRQSGVIAVLAEQAANVLSPSSHAAQPTDRPARFRSCSSIAGNIATKAPKACWRRSTGRKAREAAHD